VTRGGGVWAWGHNIDGQLGDGGTTTDRMSPVPVPGLSCVIRVAVTYHTSFALRGDGTVWSWAQTTTGTWESGAPIRTMALTPMQIPSLTGITQIARPAAAWSPG
jgi:alpha-tubulin suppressor-like RCC1 family protein